jgi:NAD(P)H-dependent FMN reductase
MPIKLLAIAGSSRTGAISRKLVTAASVTATKAGAIVTPLDLEDLHLPLYNADIEAKDGVPKGAYHLRDLFVEHDGLLLATPEYNGYPTPLFFNTFDWLSRVFAADGKISGLAATNGKVLGAMSASPGAMGGLKALGLIHPYLSGMFGMQCVPQVYALGGSYTAFDEAGNLKDKRHQAGVDAVVNAVVALAQAKKSAKL